MYGCIDEEGLSELFAGVEVVLDCALMWRERLGELCAGVEVVSGSVLMWRDWVSSVLGLRLCLTVY